MHILTLKLKILKQKLKIWNTNIFGKVHIMVKEAEDKLLQIKNQITQMGTQTIFFSHKI